MRKILVICLCLLSMMLGAQTKNSAVEVMDYREVAGKIILDMAVNGGRADFVLDLAGHNAVLPEFVEKLKVDVSKPGEFKYTNFLYKVVEHSGTGTIATISFGNNVSGNEIPFFVLRDEPYLRKLGVVGVVSGALFRDVVLTIDAKRKKITTTRPYRPSYMKLDHRADMKLLAGSGVACPVMIDGVEYSLLLDTWNEGLITLNTADFKRLKKGSGPTTPVNVSRGYAESVPVAEKAVTIVDSCLFVKHSFERVAIAESTTLPHSVLGCGILKQGLISIDYEKQKVYFQPFDLVEVKDEFIQEVPVSLVPGKLNPITRDYFMANLNDFVDQKEGVYKGEKPMIIDFWATWCTPCMNLLPEMEKLAEKYKDRVIFCKVDADKEKALCTMFNVVSLPTLFFVPVGKKPIIEVAPTLEKIVQVIEEQLLKK